MGALLQDVRYGVRILLKSPLFVLAVVSTLAVGIAANATVFSMVNAFFLRALPFPEPQELVHIWQTKRNEEYGDQRRVSIANFLDWKNQTQTLDLGAYYYQAGAIAHKDDAAQVLIAKVTAGLPSLLGVEPTLGRWFLPEEGNPGHDKVILLSYGYWQQYFSGSSDVLGKSVNLDGENYRIIGIMPRTFIFPLKATQLWVPLVLNNDEGERASGPLLVVGRLKPGRDIREARAEMAAIAQRLQIEHPQDKDVGARVIPLREALLFFHDQLEMLFSALLLAAGFVLLIVCANLANLSLARALDRTGEASIRAALGASRGRLLRQFLTENALLTFIAAAVGLILAVGALKIMQPLLPDDLYRAGNVSIDTPVLMFTLVVSATALLLFGLAPALLASKPNLLRSMKDLPAGRQAAGRWRSNLVVVQIAIATVLLAGAVLSAHAFRKQQQVDPGFATRDVLTFEVRLSPATYVSDNGVNRFFDDALLRIATLPGVKSAAAVHPLPLNFQLDLQQFQAAASRETDKKVLAASFDVTPAYFQTMRIPLWRGRTFAESDTPSAPAVVLVNRLLAEQNWPDQDPIGKQIRLFDSARSRAARVIGVVGNSKDFLMHEPLRPQIYFPQSQVSTRRRFVVVQTIGNPAAFADSARKVLQSMDAKVSPHEVRTMQQVVTEALLPFIAAAAVLGSVGICALLLAAMGVFGVAAYSVRQRTREIGIRIALGADRNSVLKMIVADGLLRAGLGLMLGLIATLALVPIVRGVAGGAVSVDAPALVVSPLLLLMATLLACYLPARRAAKVDPMVALRCE